MKKACITLLAVIMSCQFLTSCQKTTSDGITQSDGTTMTSESGSESVSESEFEPVEEEGISVGDHIAFGSYQQKSIPGTDTFETGFIEWRVLDIQDGKALIITEYLLDTTVYNYDMTDVTWETSSLRKWLNSDFYDTAFSDSEKNLIQTTKINNPDNPVYGTPGGNDTEDKVFCLSLEEAQIYFSNANDRMAAPTDYAVKRGAAVSDACALENGMKTGWWWLRSPASSSNRAADADCYGNIDTVRNDDGVDGDMVFAESNCIRPAVWIELSDDIIEIESQYSLKVIQLTADERKWSNPEEKYEDILALYSKKKCKGCLVVATDEDVVFLYAEDATEKDGQTLVSQNTVFDIASCSKVFTAVCILQLQEKGKLDINDTIDKYFPEYTHGKEITIYNLLHMDSGIPDYLNESELFFGLDGEALDNRLRDLYHDNISDEEFLKTMYAAPLLYAPGSAMTYSNTNYKLLAYIIEQVSGMKYCDYLEKYIFKPCGMKNSYAMRVDKYTYVPVDFKEQLEFGAVDEQGYSMSPNSERGDGGICTCLTDFLAFDRALFNGKLLNEESMKILLQSDKGYCCGLMPDNNGFSHTGGGFTAQTHNTIINSEKYGHIYFISMEHC